MKTKATQPRKTHPEGEWRRALRIAKVRPGGQPWTVREFRAMARVLLGRYEAFTSAPAVTPEPVRRTRVVSLLAGLLK